MISKLDKAVELVAAHTVTVTPQNEEHARLLKETPASFRREIETIGGVSDEALRHCTLQDLLDVGKKSSRAEIPLLVLKQIAAVFAADSQDGGEFRAATGYVSERKADQMTLGELLGRYVPDDENAVSRKLSSLAKGQPFIVYDSNGAVNVAVSVKLLSELRKGYPARPHYADNGTVYPLYKVGEAVDTTVDENPIYLGRPLRPDGTCDQTGRSWNGISQELRQFVAVIASSSGSRTLEQAHALLDEVTASADEAAAVGRLTSRYPASRLNYLSLQRLGKLPILRVQMSKNTGQKAKSPFAVVQGA